MVRLLAAENEATWTRVLSVKALINCFWRNANYYAHALLLLVWSNRVAIFVAHTQLIDTLVGMKVVRLLAAKKEATWTKVLAEVSRQFALEKQKGQNPTTTAVKPPAEAPPTAPPAGNPEQEDRQDPQDRQEPAEGRPGGDSWPGINKTSKSSPAQVLPCLNPGKPIFLSYSGENYYTHALILIPGHSCAVIFVARF